MQRGRLKQKTCQHQLTSASCMALRHGSTVRLMRSPTSCSNFALDTTEALECPADAQNEDTPSKLHRHVLWSWCVHRQIWQIYVRLGGRWQLTFRLLSSFTKPLHCHWVLKLFPVIARRATDEKQCICHVEQATESSISLLEESFYGTIGVTA